MQTKFNFILASKSPQRKKILRKLGVKFKCIPAHIDEHHSGYKKPHAIVKSIALRKAKFIAKKNPGSWIIGCDTIVILSDNSIAVKPKDRKDAKRMIRKYQNSFCNVYSGLALMNNKLQKAFVGYERTKIIFNHFTNDHIEDYLNTGDWRGRSGAMTIEGTGHWTKKVIGDYWNVVGLPVNLLKEMIKIINKRNVK